MSCMDVVIHIQYLHTTYTVIIWVTSAINHKYKLYKIIPTIYAQLLFLFSCIAYFLIIIQFIQYSQIYTSFR